MKHLAFRLKPGEMLKEEIETRAEKHDIAAGVVLSIVGGLSKAKLRMAGATPDTQVIKKFEGPFEIVSGTGTISKNGCHIHISISNETGAVVGGHLKDGCTVSPTAEIVIGVLEDTAFKRVMDQETGFKELEVT